MKEPDTKYILKKENLAFGKAIKVGILDVCGNGNLGDEAIQQAVIQNILKYQPEAVIYGFSCNPEDTQERHGIKSFPINRFGVRSQWWLGENPNILCKTFFDTYKKLESFPNPILRKVGRGFLTISLEFFASVRAYQHLNGINMLIISGGGQLDDDYWGAWFEPYILFFWGILAKLNNTAFVVASVGVGNISLRLSRFFIKAGLSLACYRSYRDSYSKKYLIELIKVGTDDPVYPDLAYSLTLDQYLSSPPDEDSNIVAINPIWFIPGYWSEQESTVYYGYKDSPAYNDYLDKLSKFIVWLIRNNYKVVIFSSCIGEGSEIGEKLVKDISETEGFAFSNDNIIIPSISTVDDLLNHLSRANVVLASRLHSILLAVLLNKPAIALSYHFKVDKLMEEIAQPEYCLRINEFDLESLKERFMNIIEDQKAVKEKLAVVTQERRAVLDEQYRYLFEELLG